MALMTFTENPIIASYRISISYYCSVSGIYIRIGTCYNPTVTHLRHSQMRAAAQVVCRLLQARAQLDGGPMAAAEHGLATPAAALAQEAGHMEVG